MPVKELCRRGEVQVNVALRTRSAALATEWRRFDHPPMHVPLRREGQVATSNASLHQFPHGDSAVALVDGEVLEFNVKCSAGDGSLDRGVRLALGKSRASQAASFLSLEKW